MTELTDAIAAARGPADEGPDAVVERDRPEVVRVPAYSDGRYLWQGATFFNDRDGCRVLFDDGRQATGSIAEVTEFFRDNITEWSPNL